MGKSVVAIFAVALLQIAFLGYLAVEGMREAAVSEVVIPGDLGDESARLDDLPDFYARTSTQSEYRLERRVRASTRRGRSTISRRSPSSSFKAFDSIANTTVVRSGPGIPSGYSMVLVDYSPDVLVNGRPKEIRFR